MFARWFRRDTAAETIASALYGAIVAQARTPALYAGLGVPDTVDGRFEMVVLHAALLLDRIARGDEADQKSGQAIFDAFCSDMDRSLREMGIGDLSVPKRMRKMTEAFYGRAAAYRAAIAAGDRTALAQALARNAYRADPPVVTDEALALADYVLASARRLAGAPALSDPPAFAECAAFVSAQPVA